MTDGLKDKHREAVLKVLTAHPGVEKVVLFGSRATGTFTPESDVDLCLFGDTLTSRDLARLSARIEELSIPQRVDLLLYPSGGSRATSTKTTQNPLPGGSRATSTKTTQNPLPGGSSTSSTINFNDPTIKKVEQALDPPGPWSKPRHLPHFNPGCETQMITYRLGDSLPASATSRLHADGQGESDTNYRKRIEATLDQGFGSCALRQPTHAQMVVENWRQFHADRYHLCAWVVMPNHVHVLIALTGRAPLSKIVQSWKSYTGRRLPVPWQKDYWDRCIRNEAHYRQAIDYIHQNPVSAKLCATPQDWPWSSIHGLGGSSASSTINFNDPTIKKVEQALDPPRGHHP